MSTSASARLGPAPRPSLLTADEMAAELRISVRTLHNWRDQGIITKGIIAPPGSTVLLFDRAVVIQNLQERMRQGIPPAGQRPESSDYSI